MVVIVVIEVMVMAIIMKAHRVSLLNKCALMCFWLVILVFCSQCYTCKDVPQISMIVAHDCTDVNGSRFTALHFFIIISTTDTTSDHET